MGGPEWTGSPMPASAFVGQTQHPHFSDVSVWPDPAHCPGGDRTQWGAHGGAGAALLGPAGAVPARTHSMAWLLTWMASAAEGRSWALRLAMSRRRALSLRGSASLWSRGTLNLAAAHSTAATQYTEACIEEGAATLMWARARGHSPHWDLTALHFWFGATSGRAVDSLQVVLKERCVAGIERGGPHVWQMPLLSPSAHIA